MTTKQRQKYLKKLGYYDGPVNGKSSKEYKAAILKIQKKYFKRAKDRDGIPGPDTDKLIKTVYNFRGIKNLTPNEFRCKCGKCTGYPAVINRQLILNLQDLRTKYGAIIITSGVRCKAYNNSLVGSSPTSRHMKGKAADFYNAKLTSTRSKRSAMVKRWYGYKKANYSYANTPGMGNAVHVDVK